MADISVVLVDDDPKILEGVSVRLAASPCIQLVAVIPEATKPCRRSSPSVRRSR